MTLLDAYALVAFLVGGPAAKDVRAILREGDAAVATANLAETLDVSQRVHGLAIARALEVLDPLLDGPVAVVSLDRQIASRAAEIRSRHYNRRSLPISVADAVLLGSVRPEDRIATADGAILAIAKLERLNTVKLPG